MKPARPVQPIGFPAGLSQNFHRTEHHRVQDKIGSVTEKPHDVAGNGNFNKEVTGKTRPVSRLKQPDGDLVSVQIQRHLVAPDFLHNCAVDIILLGHDLPVDYRAKPALWHTHDAGELEPHIVRG